MKKYFDLKFYFITIFDSLSAVLRASRTQNFYSSFFIRFDLETKTS